MLTIRDNGIGFDVDRAANELSGLGLIDALAAQLGGAVALSSTHGFELSVTFPLMKEASAA